MSNRLALETSPYLLQHADNPVDWYPWGEEAFAAARAAGKPVLLSIGYSACHWCHVMARESFSDPATAEVMNRCFVNVKVDREEHPAVDQVYMEALQALTGSGGWPLTAALTPLGEPFFAGTYFPPTDRPGQPAFRRVLLALADAWREQHDDAVQSAAELVAHLREQGSALAAAGSAAVLASSLPDVALALLSQQADPVHGGFGTAPKFPQPGALRFLLSRPEMPARQLALDTLQQMAAGGIFDQLGGGFARYTVDAGWVVPHFEKMLYDNAQLLSLYSAAFALTADPAYARVAGLVASWLQRELLAPEGGFHCALSAESEGREGLYYLWDAAEFDAAAAPDAELARWWFGVTDAGSLESRNVLTLRPGAWNLLGEQAVEAGRDLAGPEFTGPDGTTLRGAELRGRVEALRLRLLAVRSSRPLPDRDDKIITSWNGLAIEGLSDAGRLLDRPELLQLASGAARFVEREMWDGTRLLHSWSGGRARIAGLLEDYACFGSGLLALYQATLEPRWLGLALQLARVIELEFTDTAGTLFSTDGSAGLIIRPRGLSDTGPPADTAMAALLLLRLGRLAGNDRWLRLAGQALASVSSAIPRQPALFGTALTALELLRRPQVEVVLAGSDGDALRKLAGAVQRRYLPQVQLVHGAGSIAGNTSGDAAGDTQLAAQLPLLAGREPVGGRPAAYVCVSGTCQLPVTEVKALRAELDALLTTR